MAQSLCSLVRMGATEDDPAAAVGRMAIRKRGCQYLAAGDRTRDGDPVVGKAEVTSIGGQRTAEDLVGEAEERERRVNVVCSAKCPWATAEDTLFLLLWGSLPFFISLM